MWSRLIAVFAALAFVVVMAAPTSMVMAETKEPSVAQKAQQDKMRNCAKEWDRRKQTEGISGKTAYQAFMSICLKSETTDPRSVQIPASATTKADKPKDEKKGTKKDKKEKKEAKEEKKETKEKAKEEKDYSKDKKAKKKKDKDEDKA
ncbi:MAG: hypothetical protein Q7S17_07355, partial [Xanthobacteraceae bacterium]|nr:hypothetical protein [Xanthobacteraceae bacterium]